MIIEKTYINPISEIKLNILDKKNRLQILRIETVLGYPIINYDITINNNVGTVKFMVPTTAKIKAKIIHPFN